MCTYLTETIAVEGSGKSPAGWIALTEASVYVDHPHHAPFEHTVNIDFRNPALGPAGRVAVELTEEAALALVAAIQSALRSAPPGLASAARPARPGPPPASPAQPAWPPPQPAEEPAGV